MTKQALPFWKTKPLEKMTKREWESLCDGCGKCCLHKLEDEDNGDIHYTNVACRLLDIGCVRCTRYGERRRFVPDCTILTPAAVPELTWLPGTCAYRLVHEGRDLPAWHPLVTGDPDSAQTAGQSVRDWCISEREAGDLEDHLVPDFLIDGVSGKDDGV